MVRTAGGYWWCMAVCYYYSVVYCVVYYSVIVYYTRHGYRYQATTYRVLWSHQQPGLLVM